MNTETQRLTTEQMIERWIANASTDALKAKLAEIGEQEDGSLSQRDAEARSRLRRQLRTELTNRNELATATAHRGR